MRILKDTSIYILGEIISKSFPFFLLPYLTRSLGTEGYGELALSLMWLSILIIFIGMSQEVAIARYYFYRGKNYLKLMVGAGHILSITMFFIVFLFAILFSSTLLLILSFSALLQSFINVQLSLRQCQKRAYSYFFVQLASASLSLIFTVIIFEFISADRDGRLNAMIYANICVILVSMYSFLKQSKSSYKATPIKLLVSIKYILKYGAPLIIHQLSFVIRGQLDRLFIYSQFSSHALGIYAAGYQIASVYIVLLGAINNALLPYFFEALKSKKITEKHISKYFVNSLFISFLPASIAYIIPNEWYAILLGVGFENVKSFTCMFLLGMGLQIPYLFLVNYMFYHAKNSIIGFCTISSSIFYIIFVYLFSKYSLELVPLSLLISNAISIILLHREFKLIRKSQ